MGATSRSLFLLLSGLLHPPLNFEKRVRAAQSTCPDLFFDKIPLPRWGEGNLLVARVIVLLRDNRHFTCRFFADGLCSHVGMIAQFQVDDTAF